MEEKVLFGYLIGNDILVDIANQQMISLGKDKQAVQVTPLRATMMRLLLYMLGAARGHIITNDEIMLHVWDHHQLSSSSQRLWQVMKSLKSKLALMGIPDEFIMRVELRGYYLKHSLVTKLYCQ